MRLFWLWISALVVVTLVSPSVQMSDFEALLEFKSGLNGIQLPSWNASNPASMCSDWEGITCSNGRVTEIRLPTLVTYAINGTISPAVANLTELRRLELPAFVDIIGEFPPQIWSLPNLRSVYLAVPVEVRFPPQVSQNLWGVVIAFAKIVDPLPDIFNWTNLAVLNLRGTEMYCPLPAGLLARLRENTLVCSMTFMPLEVIDHSVCGQISVYDFGCPVFPTVVPMRAANGNNDISFTTRFKSVALECTKYDIYFYAIESNGELYRDEHLRLNLQPLQAALTGGFFKSLYGQGPLTEQFKLAPLESFSWVSSNTLNINSTMTSNLGHTMSITWIFQFVDDPTSVKQNTKIKFSIAIHNNDYDWGAAEIGAINFITIFKAQHSSVGGAPLYCPIGFSRTVCSSSIAKLDISFDVVGNIIGGSTSFTMSNQKIELSFTYGLIGSVNGSIPLTLDNTVIEGRAFLPTTGGQAYLDSYQRLNRSDMIPLAGPAMDQSLNQALGIQVPPFADFFYDPDFGLQLLFDVESAPAGTSQVEPWVIGVSTTVAAAIVIALVVVFLVPSVRVKVFPFWARARQDANAEVPLTRSPHEFGDAEASPTSPQQQQWTVAKLPPNTN